MLTPIEIQGKNFKSGFGYDKKDVDAFFREVLRNYEILYKENVELNDKISVLNEGIQYYKTIEKTLQKALVLAEQTAEETKNAANKQAKAIEKEARGQAKLIVADAQSELDRIQQMTINLVQQYEKYRIQYKQLAASQIELLESPTFDIGIANIDAFRTNFEDETTNVNEFSDSLDDTKEEEYKNSLTNDTDSVNVDSDLQENTSTIGNTNPLDSREANKLDIAEMIEVEPAKEKSQTASKELTIDSLKALLKGLTDSEVIDRLKGVKSSDGLKSLEILNSLKDFEELDELLESEGEESNTANKTESSDGSQEKKKTTDDEFEFIDFEVNLD
jgi:cell division initiation protein